MIKLFFIKQVIGALFREKKIGTLFREKIGSLKKCFKKNNKQIIKLFFNIIRMYTIIHKTIIKQNTSRIIHKRKTTLIPKFNIEFKLLIC